MALVAGVLGSVLVFGTLGFWVQAVVRVRVPRDLSAMRIALVGGGLLCVASLLLGSGDALRIVSVFGVIAAAVFLGLDRIAAMPATQPRVVCGEPAPLFAGTDSDGGAFSLESQAGRPLLLKFFRGHW